jgi:hypothetical protein
MAPPTDQPSSETDMFLFPRGRQVPSMSKRPSDGPSGTPGGTVGAVLQREGGGLHTPRAYPTPRPLFPMGGGRPVPASTAPPDEDGVLAARRVSTQEEDRGTDTGMYHSSAVRLIHLQSTVMATETSDDEWYHVSAKAFYDVPSPVVRGKVGMRKADKTKSGKVVIESRRRFVRGILELHGLEDSFKRQANGPPFKIWWCGSKYVIFCSHLMITNKHCFRVVGRRMHQPFETTRSTEIRWLSSKAPRKQSKPFACHLTWKAWRLSAIRTR